MALLDGVRMGVLEDPVGILQRLSRCLLCGACESICPRQVANVRLYLKARFLLRSIVDLPLLQKVLLRLVLAHPKRFSRLAQWTADHQDLIFAPSDAYHNVSCARVPLPTFGGRHFQRFPKPVDRSKSLVVSNYSSNKGNLRVALFKGCLLDKWYPQVLSAVRDLLSMEKIELIILHEAGCCGIPAAALGDHVTMNRLVQHNLDIFDANPFDYLVSACATCTATIKKFWSTWAEDAPLAVQRQIRDIAAKTLDVHQILVDRFHCDQKTLLGKESGQYSSVTYHDPCHLRKSLNVIEAPRKLLRTRKQLQYREMRGADTCCGMGGSFSVFHYPLASRIGFGKIDAIIETGCDVVATGCPACMMHLSDLLAQKKSPIVVRHVVELLVPPAGSISRP